MSEFPPIGIAVAPRASAANAVDDVIEQVRDAYEAGIGRIWLGQRFDYDALTLAAVVGHAVPGVHIGTSVVPINPRHPLVVASQAQTASAATHGRFTLGLGLGAPSLERPAFGIEVDKPIGRLREYLTVLRALFAEGTVDFHGETLRASTPMSAAVAGGREPSVVVAALGPQALAAAGELADGTVPFLVGPRSLESFLVPHVAAAAARAGRPAPRVIAGVAAIVTSDVDRVRSAAARQMAFYDTIPSYRAALDREGVTTSAELAVIGDEEHVTKALRRYISAGATELLVTQSDLGGPADQQRTWRLLGELTAHLGAGRAPDAAER